MYEMQTACENSNQKRNQDHKSLIYENCLFLHVSYWLIKRFTRWVLCESFASVIGTFAIRFGGFEEL